MRIAVLLAVSCLVGCGEEPEPIAEVEPETNVDKPWLEREEPDEPTPSQRGMPPVLVVDEGIVEITVTYGGESVVSSVTLDQGVFRLGDLSTLSHMRGWVTADLATWNSGDRDRDRNVREKYFAMATDYTQALFDLTTVGVLTASIEEGDSRIAQVSGQLQIGGFVQETYFDMRFSREDGALLASTVDPVPFSIGGFHRDTFMSKLAEACGRAAKLDDVVTVDAKVRLIENTEPEIPMVIRMPVTISTLDEMQQRLAERTDHFAEYQEHQKELGVSAGIRNNMSRDQYQTIQHNRNNPNIAADVRRMQAEALGETSGNEGQGNNNSGPITVGEGQTIVYDGKQQRVIGWEEQ